MSDVKAIVWDLDGTILDTESLVANVARAVVSRRGKVLTKEILCACSGRTPLDSWKAAATALGLVEEGAAQSMLDESEPLLSDMWPHCKTLPGALRLIQHLHKHGIPQAIATSTPRRTFEAKMKGKEELRGLFEAVVCGDEVSHGKPHPELFLAAAKALGIPPSNCVAFEDSISGIESATRAGMRVIAVPSQRGQGYPEPDPFAVAGVIELLPSLFAVKAEMLHLPPFEDLAPVGVIPFQHSPISIKGTVVKGFGRGSKDLGIPTANVDAEALHSSLADSVTGIYCGWVSIGQSSEVYKTAVSIGWNPHFDNEEKTCEPWILHDFEGRSFYGEEIRLLIVGYIRPEVKFTTLEALIKRILEDGEVAKVALEDERMARHRSDSFLKINYSA